MKRFFKPIIAAILIFEAHILLLRTRPKIIAITGSVGKTSTKDAIYAVIKKKVRARKSEKTYNTELGVPLTILGLQNAWSNPIRWTKNIIEGIVHALFPGDYPDWLVLEVGINAPGDMTRLTSLIKPDILVLTRLPDVPVHVEYFDSPEAVIEEKKQLVYALKDDGVLIYNNDDEKASEIAEGIRQRSVGFSRYSLSPYTASADQVVYKDGRAVGLEFTLTHEEEAVIMHVHGSLGVQQTYNYAAAAAVGSMLGITLEEAAEALHEFTPPPGRMRIIDGLKETLIIDDTYNSSPVAAAQSLHTLKEVKGARRKIAVLADMLELGQYSVREHEKLGKLVAECSDVLLTIGVRARKIAEGALEAGMSEKVIFQYEQIERAGRELQQMITVGDIILIKGSQSLRTEKTVKEIMAEPQQAPELLVRQDPMWQRI